MIGLTLLYYYLDLIRSTTGGLSIIYLHNMYLRIESHLFLQIEKYSELKYPEAYVYIESFFFRALKPSTMNIKLLLKFLGNIRDNM